MAPLRCTIGCNTATDPVVGFANLRGALGTQNQGHAGVYPLCAFHRDEILNGNWPSVVLEGWEDLPQEIKEPTTAAYNGETTAGGRMTPDAGRM